MNARELFLATCLVIGGIGRSVTLACDVAVTNGDSDSATTISLNAGIPFHSTGSVVTDARCIDVPNDPVPTTLVLWTETTPDGTSEPWYGISLDGMEFVRVTPTSYTLNMRFARFDPLLASPAVPAGLESDGFSSLHIVQFVTQPLELFQKRIEELGGTFREYIPYHAYLVEMDEAVREQVQQLPFVRWVGPFHPAYRVADEVMDTITNADPDSSGQRYNIAVHRGNADHLESVRQAIMEAGGIIDNASVGDSQIEATLTPEQLVSIVRHEGVTFVDRWSPPQLAMDKGRQVSGANYAEGVAGYRGQGVRGAVVDAELYFVPNSNPPEYHGDLKARTAGGITYSGPILQTDNPLGDIITDPAGTHGTGSFGIVFAHGIDDPLAKGFMPLGQGIFAYYPRVNGRRSEYTCLLDTIAGPSNCLQNCGVVPLEDPSTDSNCPYRAVLQTNSWFSSGETIHYTTGSAAVDSAAFTYKKILHLHSMGNPAAPPPNNIAAPEGWAKNVITVGAITHHNTACRTGDPPDGPDHGSNGPALDGRIKPDLCFFYDAILTTAAGGGYTADAGFSYGGTSGATPMVAGCAGLFYEMWGKPKAPNALVNTFGRTLANAAGDVFDNRCSAALAKAMLINTARQYEFSGSIDRFSSGWGCPDVRRIHELRDRFPIIVDESIVLPQFGYQNFTVQVEARVPALKATLVYADPPGTPMSTGPQLRNDLTLHATSPSDVKYVGNRGLEASHWSTPCPGHGYCDLSDDINNVENIFIEEPEPGEWTFRVNAYEISMDGHLATPGVMDADFALVISVDYPRCPETVVSTFCASCCTPESLCAEYPDEPGLGCPGGTGDSNCCDANVCTYNWCSGTCGECQFEGTRYGNVNGDPNHLVTVDDIICAMDCFADYAECPNADIAPPCTGDGICTMDDILAVLGAFSGADPCGCVMPS